MSWLKAIFEGFLIGLFPVRNNRSWPGRILTGLVAVIILGIVGVGVVLTAAGSTITVDGGSFPLHSAEAGAATLGFVTFLYFVSTIRQRRRLNQLDHPLRARTAQFIRLGSEFFPVIESCETGMDLERTKEGIHGWNSAVYDTLNRSRRDWAARFTSAYATPVHLEQAPETRVGHASLVWANLQAQIDVLKELFRESGNATGMRRATS